MASNLPFDVLKKIQNYQDEAGVLTDEKLVGAGEGDVSISSKGMGTVGNATAASGGVGVVDPGVAISFGDIGGTRS